MRNASQSFVMKMQYEFELRACNSLFGARKESDMDLKKIMVGGAIWSISLSILLLYHVLLMFAAVQENGYSYSYHNMVKDFFDLPWIVWPYLIAAWLVGTSLVASGLKSS